MNVQHSCVDGWTGALGGVGNHGNDPRFIDADGPDDIYARRMMIRACGPTRRASTPAMRRCCHPTSSIWMMMAT